MVMQKVDVLLSKFEGADKKLIKIDNATGPPVLIFLRELSRAHSRHHSFVSTPGQTGFQAAGLQPPGLEH